jgi:hypothetical protein
LTHYILGTYLLHNRISSLFPSKISLGFSWRSPFSARGQFAMKTPFFQCQSKLCAIAVSNLLRQILAFTGYPVSKYM